MAIEVPTVWPSSITAGNTVKFTVENSDFPPSTWTLTYTLVSSAASYDVTATDNGDGSHLFSANSSVTTTWAEGHYSFFISASDGADRYTVAQGSIDVLPNPESGAYDPRSHAKKVLDSLDALLEGKATKDQESYSINGRSISRMSIEDLIMWRDRYKALYAQEQQAERVAAGLGSSRKIKVRFR